MTTADARELLKNASERNKNLVENLLEKMIGQIQDKRTRNNWDAQDWVNYFTLSCDAARLQELADKQKEIKAQLHLLEYLKPEEEP